MWIRFSSLVQNYQCEENFTFLTHRLCSFFSFVLSRPLLPSLGTENYVFAGIFPRAPQVLLEQRRQLVDYIQRAPDFRDWFQELMQTLKKTMLIVDLLLEYSKFASDCKSF